MIIGELDEDFSNASNDTTADPYEPWPYDTATRRKTSTIEKLIDNLENYIGLLSPEYGLSPEQQQRLVDDLRKAIVVITKAGD